jgi:hypothetical protein
LKFESAEQSMKKMLAFCERPSSRVRFRFGDGDWEEASGPDFLERFKSNRSGRLTVDWVAETVRGEDGN